jgi:hypothetical protein
VLKFGVYGGWVEADGQNQSARSMVRIMSNPLQDERARPPAYPLPPDPDITPGVRLGLYVAHCLVGLLLWYLFYRFVGKPVYHLIFN